MTKWPPHLVLEAVRATAQPVLHSAFRPDCCIAATRITIDVLKRFGIHASPKPVVTVAGCRAFVEWQDRDPEGPAPEGAYYLITDIHHDRPGGFAGHLVATGKVAGQHFILDLSAAQMHRPAKSILVPEPILLTRPNEWPEDRAIKVPLPDGGRLIYSHHPKKDIRWEHSRDWTIPGFRRPIFDDLVAQIISAAEAHVEQSRRAA